jgi:hypothetical protein
MTDRFLELDGKRALVCAAEGSLLGEQSDADDFLSLAFSADAELLVVPVSRIDPRFFDLRNGVAGQIVQRFANYGVQTRHPRRRLRMDRAKSCVQGLCL